MGAIEGTTNFWTSVSIHSKLAIIVEHKLKAIEKLNTATINVLVLNPQLRACVDEANKMKSKKQLLLRNTETYETRNKNTNTNEANKIKSKKQLLNTKYRNKRD